MIIQLILYTTNSDGFIKLELRKRHNVIAITLFAKQGDKQDLIAIPYLF